MLEELLPGYNQAEGLPRRTGDKGGVTGLSWHTTFGAWPTRSEAAPAGRLPRTALWLTARDEPSQTTNLPTVLHFWGGGPRKCGVLRRARAGDGPGAKLLACRRLRPGGAYGKRCYEAPMEALNITSCCVRSENRRGLCPDLLHNSALCYVPYFQHRRSLEAPTQPGRSLHLPGEAGRGQS